MPITPFSLYSAVGCIPFCVLERDFTLFSALNVSDKALWQSLPLEQFRRPNQPNVQCARLCLRMETAEEKSHANMMTVCMMKIKTVVMDL